MNDCLTSRMLILAGQRASIAPPPPPASRLSQVKYGVVCQYHQHGVM